jgi:predicted amidohydrolase
MLVFGMVERAGGRYYNRAVVIAGGKVVGRYRKPPNAHAAQPASAAGK